MITINQQPNAIAFSRNPMVYELQSNRLYQSAGAAYVGILTFGAGYLVSTGFNFTLTYGSTPLKFFTSPFAGGYQDDGYTLPKADTLSFDDWMTANLAVFQSNFFLNRDFIIDLTFIGGIKYIRFTAKQVGDQYSITLDDTTVASLTQLTAGAGKQPQPNFKLMIEVFMQKPDSAEFELLSQAFTEVDDAGKSIYDLSATLTDGLAAYGFDRPALNMPSAEYCPNTCRNYYLKIAEVWGVTQQIRAVTQTTTKAALYGGFSKRMREELVFPGYFADGALLKFLDQEPNLKITHLKQPEFLTLCNFGAAIATLKQKVVVTFNDNTAQTVYNFPYTDVVQYAKLYFPSGYSQLNLGLIDDTKTVAQWDITIVNNAGTALSETRTYLIDYSYRPYGNYLLYQNSFGAYVSSFTYGKASREYDLVFQSAEITPAGGFRLIEGERLDYDQQISSKLTLATGFITRRALLLYKDLILSTDKFLIDKGKAVPISIISKTIKEFKDGDNIYALTFDIGFQWNEELYTYDPEETDPYTPADLSNYVPPTPTDTMPDNFDDRYYLKTLTYNRVEIDGKITTEASARNTEDVNLQAQINAFVASLATKMDVTANFDSRYYTKDQIDTYFLGIVGVIVIDKPAGSPNPIVIPTIQTTYPNLGSKPSIICLQKMSSTVYKDRTDLQPVRTFIGANLDNISIDVEADIADPTKIAIDTTIYLKA
ncbi:hypothetical protein [Mucilaginibacter sp.]|uniref:hypothetical protein n=1 Tax=Mucilaginibacter sp. TaxID=1882438 RepID=UPI00263A393A|nr:hypothetical protein [Mucilaginibacter sp.]MDB4919850.1 hypothetical protein [Mucilaginibacter sp.]